MPMRRRRAWAGSRAAAVGKVEALFADPDFAAAVGAPAGDQAQQVD